MAARNPTRPTFCSAVAPLLRRVERVSFNALRAAGLLVLALAVVGAAMGA